MGTRARNSYYKFWCRCRRVTLKKRIENSTIFGARNSVCSEHIYNYHCVCVCVYVRKMFEQDVKIKTTNQNIYILHSTYITLVGLYEKRENKKKNNERKEESNHVHNVVCLKRVFFPILHTKPSASMFHHNPTRVHVKFSIWNPNEILKPTGSQEIKSEKNPQQIDNSWSQVKNVASFHNISSCIRLKINGFFEFRIIFIQKLNKSIQIFLLLK